MQKKILQDVKIIKRKPDRLVRLERPDSDMHASSEVSRSRNQNKGRSKYALWIVAAVSVVFFLFAISYMFLKVTVTINPKTADIALKQNFSAEKGAGTEALPFDLVVISGEENTSVQATEERETSEKAKGAAIIYNNFSSAPQRLDIDTRLEGSNGKIYKTEKLITVPGKEGNTPGSVEVGIYAALPGEEYNSGPLDFTIFGFKGTPKYSKFYARSKDEITGGFVGKVPFVTESQKLSAVGGLKSALQAKLFKKAADQIPNGFILFKDAAFMNIDEESVDYASANKDKMLPFKLRATLYGILFDEQKLSQKIAENNIKGYDGSAILIPDIRDLVFSLAKGEAFSPDIKKIDFNLKGDAKIVYRLDEAKFTADLVGKSKKDFNQILSKYPNIISADLMISPFWKGTLAKKAKDIKVIVNYPK